MHDGLQIPKASHSALANSDQAKIGSQRPPKTLDPASNSPLIEVSIWFTACAGALFCSAHAEQLITLDGTTTVQNAASLGRVAENEPAVQPYDNYDLTGNELRSLPDTDLQSCSAACQSERQCRAHSFNKLKRVCSLKSETGLLRFSGGFVAGIPGSLPSTSDVLLEMFQTKSEALKGETYRTPSTSSYDQCEATCENDEKCVGLDYSSKQQTCTLFQTISGANFDPDTNSAIKDQLTAEQFDARKQLISSQEKLREYFRRAENATGVLAKYAGTYGFGRCINVIESSVGDLNLSLALLSRWLYWSEGHTFFRTNALRPEELYSHTIVSDKPISFNKSAGPDWNNGLAMPSYEMVPTPNQQIPPEFLAFGGDKMYYRKEGTSFGFATKCGPIATEEHYVVDVLHPRVIRELSRDSDYLAGLKKQRK